MSKGNPIKRESTMKSAVSCDTIGNLDHGTARVAIDLAIRTVIADLDDRGEDGKPRKVNITLEFSKMEGGQIVTSVEVGTALPKLRSAGTIGRIARKDGKSVVMFQDLDPRDPDQTTVDEFIKDDAEDE